MSLNLQGFSFDCTFQCKVLIVSLFDQFMRLLQKKLCFVYYFLFPEIWGNYLIRPVKVCFQIEYELAREVFEISGDVSCFNEQVYVSGWFPAESSGF